MTATDPAFGIDLEAELTLETVRIQAEILVPLARILRKELGTARADQLLHEALAPWARALGRKLRDSASTNTLETLRSAVSAMSGVGQETEFLPSAAHELNYNITGCCFADFYRALGLGELGFLFVCSLDDAIMPAFDPKLSFARSQTIMQGASHCEFRFRRERD
jgi:hypothetical protein